MVAAVSQAGLVGGVDRRFDAELYHLPREHDKNLKSTNMLERLMEGLKRRTVVVRIFPQPGKLPALGARLGGGDSRKLDQGDPLSEHGTLGGTKERTLTNCSRGLTAGADGGRTQSPSCPYPAQGRKWLNHFAELGVQNFASARSLARTSLTEPSPIASCAAFITESRMDDSDGGKIEVVFGEDGAPSILLRRGQDRLWLESTSCLRFRMQAPEILIAGRQFGREAALMLPDQSKH
jgi:hypothetical protein